MDKRRTASPARTTGLILIALAWALFLALSGFPEAILFTVPVFLLAAPLALERYVGEDALTALRSRRPRRTARHRAVRLIDGTLPVSGRLASGVVPGRGPPAVTF
jgi:hypothetical protein